MQVKFVKIGLNKFMQFGILAFRALERMGHWPTVKKIMWYKFRRPALDSQIYINKVHTLNGNRKSTSYSPQITWQQS